MIYNIGQNGASANLSPSTISAGSTQEKLFVVSPYPPTVLCSVTFVYPNGVTSYPVVGEPISPTASQEINIAQDGTSVGSVHELTIPAAVTANSGQVEMFASFTGADGGIKTAPTVTFNVHGISASTIESEITAAVTVNGLISNVSALANKIGTPSEGQETTVFAELGAVKQDVIDNKTACDNALLTKAEKGYVDDEIAELKNYFDEHGVDGAFHFAGKAIVPEADSAHNSVNTVYGNEVNVDPSGSGQHYTFTFPADAMCDVTFDYGDGYTETAEQIAVENNGKINVFIAYNNDRTTIWSEINSQRVVSVKGDIMLTHRDTGEVNYPESITGADFADMLIGGFDNIATYRVSFVAYKPTTPADHRGAVYLVGDAEYVCDGTRFIKLGIDHSIYMRKDSIAQGTGASESSVMSQKAVTDAISGAVAGKADDGGVYHIKTDTPATPWQLYLPYQTRDNTGALVTGHRIASVTAAADNIAMYGTGGQLRVPATPVGNTDAASKAYVDGKVAEAAANVDITGLAPADHEHPASDITDLGDVLSAALSGKASASHGHEIGEVYELETTLADIDGRLVAAEGTIGDHSAVIPTQASASNQLADKAFVNSSIATNTATYRGTVSAVSALPTTGVDINDYAFVTSTGESGNTIYTRYKYNGSAWVEEYVLNNTGFTAAQWAAVNSGVTASVVEAVGTHATQLADLEATVGDLEATVGDINTALAAILGV